VQHGPAGILRAITVEDVVAGLHYVRRHNLLSVSI
jgi:hypothetical protein